MHSEIAWSYLDHKPLCMYDPKFNSHLVFWNGVAMTRTYALMIYGKCWLNLYPTRSMNKSSWEEYNKIYRSGGFLTKEWDDILKNVYEYNLTDMLIRFMIKNDLKFLSKLKEMYSPKEALEWFMPSRELVKKYDTN